MKSRSSSVTRPVIHGVAAQPFTQGAQNIRRQRIDPDGTGTGERLVDLRQFDILEPAMAEMAV